MNNLVKQDRATANYEWALSQLKLVVERKFWGTLIIKMENGIPETIKVEENIKPPRN